MRKDAVLTGPAILAARRMYAEKDKLGRKVYSQARIAAELGVSETTIFRVVNELGPYVMRTSAITKSEEELQRAAEEDMARFTKLMEAANAPKG